MEKALEKNEENKTSPFQWFLLVVLIPILFAIVVALIVSTVAGVNVFEVAKEYGGKVPFVGNIMDKTSEEKIAQFEEERIDLESQINDREAKLEKLQSQLDNKDKEIERIQLEKERLLQEIDDLTAIQQENKRAFKDIVRTYETLSAKKAAPIITQMSESEALKILTNVKAETLADLMENMKPEEAAKYTELLTNETGKKTP